MAEHLKRMGYRVNRKRVRRLMCLMGIEAIYPKPKTTSINKDHKIYPYLLRNYEVTASNQVWSADINYIPMNRGFMYLVAILDWYSRYVIAWELSNTLEGQFCLDALRQALSDGTPEIFNTDRGVQFTTNVFAHTAESAGSVMSMDGVRRGIDNVYNERFWRSVKYEDVYLKLYQMPSFTDWPSISDFTITNDRIRVSIVLPQQRFTSMTILNLNLKYLTYFLPVLV